MQVRPGAVTARCGVPELLSRDDVLSDANLDVLAQMTVDRADLHVPARDDHVVVDRGHRVGRVLVGKQVGDVDDGAVDRGEDGHADPLLLKRPDDRVLSGVPVIGLGAAVPVEHTRPGVEIHEVREVQVLPGDARLRIEGEGGGPAVGRAAGGR